MRITLQQLIDAGACKNQLELFAKLFGNSVEVTEERALLVVDQFDWSWAGRLLSESACAEYDRVRALAWAEFNRVCALAWAEYDRVPKSAQAAEYDRVSALAWARLYNNPTGPWK